MGFLQSCTDMVQVASNSKEGQYITIRWTKPLKECEEPDVGKLLVRFCEGLRHNWCMAEIMWHRRETRRQTEKTNRDLQPREELVYSTRRISQGWTGCP